MEDHEKKALKRRFERMSDDELNRIHDDLADRVFKNRQVISMCEERITRLYDEIEVIFWIYQDREILKEREKEKGEKENE